MLKLAVTVATLASLTAIFLSVSSSAAADPTHPYTNHTVGGPTGWLFNAKKNASATDYSSWAKAQSFFLGDFLIFKSNANVTVIQTNNKTTYGLCDASEDGGDGTFVWSGEEIAIPLTAEGTNYFFAEAGDAIQCQKGMRFEIEVGKGRGLPASLAQPPPPPYVEPATPPPPEPEGNVVGGSPQEESFYTGAAAGGPKGSMGAILGVSVLLFFFSFERVLCVGGLICI